MKRRINITKANKMLCFALMLAFMAVINVTAANVNSLPLKPLKVEKADEWTELFNRMEGGWMGADGVYSFALNGIDSIGSANSETKTFFTFCDTNLGEADPKTLKWKEVRMAHNTAAILTGAVPDPDKIAFKYGKKASMTYGGNMKENSLYGYKVWPQDGILTDNYLYLLAHKTDNAMNPLGVDEIRIPIVNGEPDFSNYTVFSDVPLFLNDGNFDISFGAGVLDNTESAGAMDPDGYVYIYGIRCSPKNALDKQLVVSRVRKEDYTDKSKWEFFDGKKWSSNLASVNNDSAILARMVSNELSVTPINSGIYKGKYMLVYSVGGIIPELEYRIGETPYGPFDDPVKFYDIPEPDIYEGAVVYNAKAHPHLSKPGELLISYNVNLWLVIPETSEIYRPRFLTLKLDQFAEPVKKSSDRTNVAAGKPVTASHNEKNAGKAVDKSWKNADMWVGAGDGDKWLRTDLGDTYKITRWVVRHSSAGGGATAYNTRDYKLQVSMDGNAWTDADTAVCNTAPVTDRTIDAISARYVRLYISKPTQSADTTARIYEFEVYGKVQKKETPAGTPASTKGDDETIGAATPNETPDSTDDNEETPDKTPDSADDNEETPDGTPVPSVSDGDDNNDNNNDDNNDDNDDNAPDTGDKWQAVIFAAILLLAGAIVFAVRRRLVK